MLCQPVLDNLSFFSTDFALDQKLKLSNCPTTSNPSICSGALIRAVGALGFQIPGMMCVKFIMLA